MSRKTFDAMTPEKKFTAIVEDLDRLFDAVQRLTTAREASDKTIRKISDEITDLRDRLGLPSPSSSA